MLKRDGRRKRGGVARFGADIRRPATLETADSLLPDGGEKRPGWTAKARRDAESAATFVGLPRRSTSATQRRISAPGDVGPQAAKGLWTNVA
jgi:hypothetical protein